MIVTHNSIRTKRSHSCTSKIYGVGVNDADYMVTKYVDGKHINCPYYNRWSGMLERCYSHKHNQAHPSYRETTVDNRWLSFMKFKSWMEKQNWKDRALDKDLLMPGNQKYAPYTCLFIPKELNNLIRPIRVKSDGLPLGICLRGKQYIVRVGLGHNGDRGYFGLFNDLNEAIYVLKQVKINRIKDEASKYQKSEPRLFNALIDFTRYINEVTYGVI